MLSEWIRTRCLDHLLPHFSAASITVRSSFQLMEYSFFRSPQSIWRVSFPHTAPRPYPLASVATSVSNLRSVLLIFQNETPFSLILRCDSCSLHHWKSNQKPFPSFTFLPRFHLTLLLQ